MKWILTLVFFGGLLGMVAGQSVDDLKQELANAKSSEDKMRLNYELGNLLRNTNNADEALTYARNTHQLALSLNNKNMVAQSAFLISLVYERQRDKRNQEVWLRSATEFAKQAGDVDLIMNTVEKRGRLATLERKEQRAIEIYRDAFEYFSQRGNSISELEQKYARQKKQLEQEKQRMEQEILVLVNERDHLTSANTELSAQKNDLIEEKQEVEQTVTRKERELATVSEEKQRQEAIAQEAMQVATEKTLQYDQLSKETLIQQLALEEARANLAEAEIDTQRSRNLIRIAGLAAAFLLILSLLSYGRYRASRRAKKTLEEKNAIIEHERERSDELLLNILPAPIANELKEKGRAKARRYDEVTVFFADFKNFTQISEHLGPEELVEELDQCFQAFDHIIAQYSDIEKIKTIGDAYMCVSGLSERKTLPVNLVRAALQMQHFLAEHKREKEANGLPFFEARIGLHTGPVVAGVVGVKKFAYDIWGDTVNTASRVEANCQEGRVNISETTYKLIQHRFDCEPRGKVEAKNKGAIDMYFVNKELKAVPVG